MRFGNIFTTAPTSAQIRPGKKNLAYLTNIQKLLAKYNVMTKNIIMRENIPNPGQIPQKNKMFYL